MQESGGVAAAVRPTRGKGAGGDAAHEEEQELRGEGDVVWVRERPAQVRIRGAELMGESPAFPRFWNGSKRAQPALMESHWSGWGSSARPDGRANYVSPPINS